MSELDDVLPLPEQADVHLICPDILVMRNVVPAWRNELIQIAEKIKRWHRSGQVGPDGGPSYTGAHRTSRSMMITTQDPIYGACLRRFEEALVRVFHSGVLAYAQYNPHLKITDDSGYELLRYQEGEHFGLHTDAILGRNEGFRQLSGLIYLNDDYEGGETEFPRQGIKFKGSAGDLLLFPSNFCYPHQSLPVTQGTKFAIVTWFVAYPKVAREEGKHVEAAASSVDAGFGVDDGLCVQQPARSGSLA